MNHELKEEIIKKKKKNWYGSNRKDTRSLIIESYPVSHGSLTRQRAHSQNRQKRMFPAPYILCYLQRETVGSNISRTSPDNDNDVLRLIET